MRDKAENLARLREDWVDCTRCPLHETRQQVVFGEGNPDAQIMIVGEAPWKEEERVGIPFVGQAGQILDSLLAATSVNPQLNGEDLVEDPVERKELLFQEIYYTNVVMCRPFVDYGEGRHGIRPPSQVEINACHERLMEEIYQVDPVLIIAAGTPAVSALCGRPMKITDLLGDVIEISVPGRIFAVTYPVLCVYHPSYLGHKGSETVTKSMDFTNTYNDICRAREIIDVYNLENFGIEVPLTRPGREAITPEQRREAREIALKASRMSRSLPPDEQDDDESGDKEEVHLGKDDPDLDEWEDGSSEGKD